MTLTTIWFFIIPFVIAAALPGPAQGTMIATVMARGRASAVSFVTGMVIGNSIWLIATIFGLASIALRYEALFVAVKWCGVAYLLFIAWKLWTAPVDAADGTAQKPKGFAAGMLLTLGNPKAVVFFGAILPQAFDLSALSFGDALLIVALGAALDTAVQSAYLLGVLKARRVFGKPVHMRRVNRVAASLIGGCALLVARR
ncbi:threonine/homoserine/homoserine lactone efflux protein [Pseudoduganella flava]|uniref:LysE family transporter n=2 Tax=Pseudoduganella flava TaxID=871742 RepID=A0A562PQ31_9BURK|nr:LysE family transporter [Pseudoduganella flava]TWI46565.1 threonine/homoserine/homoserine lactone efflux protein [Pseudoduganella flava]